MSKQIDLTKPLSDDDRAYLEQRSRFAEIEYSDSLQSGETEMSDEERMELEQRAIAEAKGKRVPLQMDPDAVREEDDADEDSGEEAEVQEGDDPDDVAYVNTLKVADLQEQLQGRGLSTSGLKPELQRRLLDALKSESQEQ